MNTAIELGNSLFPENEIAVYVPPSNILSEEGRRLLHDEFPQIKVIASLYLEGQIEYAQEFEVAEDEMCIRDRPDGVVLCINEYDNIDYIKKSIKFAESVVDCKVIAIVLFPMTYSNKLSGIYSKKRYISTDEFNRINNLVSSEIMLPVYILGNEQHMDMLFTDIINFFS